MPKCRQYPTDWCSGPVNSRGKWDCPLGDGNCQWNKRKFPRPGFQQELEDWSNNYLQPLIKTLDRDEDLASAVSQLKDDIDLIQG